VNRGGLGSRIENARMEACNLLEETAMCPFCNDVMSKPHRPGVWGGQQAHADGDLECVRRTGVAKSLP
jgi:hypothetical protein